MLTLIDKIVVIPSSIGTDIPSNISHLSWLNLEGISKDLFALILQIEEIIRYKIVIKTAKSPKKCILEKEDKSLTKHKGTKIITIAIHEYMFVLLSTDSNKLLQILSITEAIIFAYVKGKII